MGLVAVAVPGGDRRPVGPGLAAERAGHPAQPLDPGEALWREPDPGGEAAAQRAGEQPQASATWPTGGRWTGPAPRRNRRVAAAGPASWASRPAPSPEHVLRGRGGQQPVPQAAAAAAP